MEHIDTAVWNRAVLILKRVQGRYRTKCRAIKRDIARGETKTIPTPRSFVSFRKHEDTFSDRFEISTRQDWADITDLSAAKRETLFLYLGVLYSQWLDAKVTIVASKSHSDRHESLETFYVRVANKK